MASVSPLWPTIAGAAEHDVSCLPRNALLLWLPPPPSLLLLWLPPPPSLLLLWLPPPLLRMPLLLPCRHLAQPGQREPAVPLHSRPLLALAWLAWQQPGRATLGMLRSPCFRASPQRGSRL